MWEIIYMIIKKKRIIINNNIKKNLDIHLKSI